MPFAPSQRSDRRHNLCYRRLSNGSRGSGCRYTSVGLSPRAWRSGDRSPGTISTVPTPPTPDSVTASLLEHFFGSPSLVVATFLVLNALWAWWGLSREGP